MHVGGKLISKIHLKPADEREGIKKNLLRRVKEGHIKLMAKKLLPTQLHFPKIFPYRAPYSH